MRYNLGYRVAALEAIVVLRQWWSEAQTLHVVPYSAFKKLLSQDGIAEGAVGEHEISGLLKIPPNGNGLVLANCVDPSVAERLHARGIPCRQLRDSAMPRDLVSWLLPPFVLFGAWHLTARRVGRHCAGGVRLSTVLAPRSSSEARITLHAINSRNSAH